MTRRIDRQTPDTMPLRRAGQAGATGPTPPIKGAAEAATPQRLGGDERRLSQAGARDVSDIARFMEDQGTTNGCGTTSLGVLLNFWKNEEGLFNREMIDQSIRAGNMFTSPDNIVSYARERGFRSAVQNNSTLDDLKGYVAQGVPVQVLIDPGKGSDATLHYVNVVGYDAARDEFLIADPNDGPQQGLRRMGAAEFEQKWDNLKFLNLPTALDRVMIVHLPGQNTPVKGPDGRVRMSDDIALPERQGSGVGGFVADLVADVGNGAIRAWETTKSTAKKVWGAITSL